MKIKNIVFDLGGVLIDWNPRYLFRKILKSSEEIEFLIENVCNNEWNEKQDAGRSFAEGVAELIKIHPEFESHIKTYDARWEEMLNGPIPSTLAVLEELHKNKEQRLIALTNWNQDKFQYAKKIYHFLQYFEHIVVSGEIKMIKPDPEIFHYMCKKCEINPEETLFIDDNLKNIEAAKQLGFKTIHFNLDLDLKSVLDKALL